MRSSGASIPERCQPDFGPLRRLFGLSVAFGGEHRPRVWRSAASGRRRGLDAAALAPLERPFS
jgi:hypothetical protein